jgi:hypothetical protein
MIYTGLVVIRLHIGAAGARLTLLMGLNRAMQVSCLPFRGGH